MTLLLNLITERCRRYRITNLYVPKTGLHAENKEILLQNPAASTQETETQQMTFIIFEKIPIKISKKWVLNGVSPANWQYEAARGAE